MGTTGRDRHTLGDVQLAIMRVLWHRGEASVAEVHEALRTERDVAPTTVATMLVKMERKGVVTHRTEGRRYIYAPSVEEDAVRRTMVGELRDKLFRGDVPAFVSHLLSEHELEPEDVRRLRELIATMEED